MKSAISLMIGSLLATQAATATHVACVGSAAELTTALAGVSTAPGKDDADEIRIRVGNYIAPAAGWVTTASRNHDLAIRGGYTDTACTQRTMDASATVLDGANVAGILAINADAFYVADIEVSGLTFQNGNSVSAFGTAAGGLKVSDPGPIANGNILVERNIFRNNTASGAEASSAGGLVAATDGQSLIVRNNLFVNNSGPKIAAAYAFSNNRVDISNNTFTKNAANDATQQRVVMDFFSLTGVWLSNNIVWANPPGDNAFDLHFDAQTRRTTLTNNDIQTSTGTPVAAIGTVSVSPRFVGVTDYRLQPGSPLINTGTNNPSGGLAVADLDGAPRVAAGLVDLGAYEYSGAKTLQGGLSGTYYAPTRSGEGVLVDFGRLGEQPVVFFSWYTYGVRTQQWLVGSNMFDASQTSVTMEVINTSGASFGAAFRPEDVVRTSWGSVTLRFPDCATMELSYAPLVGAPGTVVLSRALDRLGAARCE